MRNQNEIKLMNLSNFEAELASIIQEVEKKRNY